MIEIKNGQAKCSVCGGTFPLVVKEHYISRDDGQVGVVALFKAQPEDQLYDTFDCPHCGCQNIVQKRKRMYIPCGIEVEEEAEVQTLAEEETKVEVEDDG